MASFALQASLTIRAMPPDLPPTPPPAIAPPQRPGARLRVAAVLILVVGLLAAGAAWFTADDAATESAGYRIVGGQAFATTGAAAADRQTERLGGRALVRVAALDRWLGSLWHGRRLAGVLAVVAVAAAALCLWIAGPAARAPDA